MASLRVSHRCSLVACPVVDQVWPFVTYGFQHACDKTGGGYSSEHFWSLCRSGQAYLIIVTDGEHVIGASVWQFQDWSSGKKFRCLCLYGERSEDWDDQLFQLAKQYAQQGGAKTIVWGGRPGWKRRMPTARVIQMIYEMEL
jgi:hypothetical protein